MYAAVAMHAVTWVSINLYDSGLSFYHENIQQPIQERAQLELWSNCSLMKPEDWNLEYDKSKSSDGKMDPGWFHIVGQSQAVKITTDTLDSWEKSEPLLSRFCCRWCRSSFFISQTPEPLLQPKSKINSSKTD